MVRPGSGSLRLLVSVLIGAGGALSVLPVAASSQSGLVYATSGLCAGSLEIVGTGMCTHGPDPIPDAITPRGAAQPQQSTQALNAATAVACNGDGESGKRVQALYAYVAGRADRRASYLSSFRTWAARVDTMLQASAADTGGNRHLRWVTNTCQLSVTSVALSTLAETNFARTITELAVLGYNRTDRRYLIWFDSDPRNSPICGIATTYPDDQASPGGNLNELSTGYARVDYACWNWSEPHELMHTLGGVQRTAPHGTNGLHCTDEHDQMCYEDGVGTILTYPCGNALYEERFDCGHDDYFHTSPTSGSYLATHWNTANSGWLVDEPPDTTPPVVAEPDGAFVAGQGMSASIEMRFSWPAASDKSGIAAYELQSRKGSGSWTDVPLASPTDTSVVIDLTVGAAYSFRLRATDGAGNTGAWATSGARTVTLVQENATAVSYAGSWKRATLSGASGGYVKKSSTSGSVATYTFSASDVAYVSTLGASRGIAAVRLDSGTWQSIDLYRSATQTRFVAWVASPSAGTHTVQVRVTGSANPAATGTRLDVDAFLVWKPV